jgi:hypothetical protein
LQVAYCFPCRSKFRYSHKLCCIKCPLMSCYCSSSILFVECSMLFTVVSLSDYVTCVLAM